MIHHIVMFKITDFEDELDRMKRIEELKSIFEKLTSKIKSIKTYEVGININTSSQAYDVIINSTFKSQEDLQAYVDHPEHQYAIEKAKSIRKIKVVADYEVTRIGKSPFRKGKKV